MLYFVLSLIYSLLSFGIMYWIGKEEKDVKLGWMIGIALFIGGFFHFCNFAACSIITWYMPTVYIQTIVVAGISIAIGWIMASGYGDFFDNKACTYSTLGAGVITLSLLGSAAYSLDLFWAGHKQEMLSPKVVKAVKSDSIVAATDIHNLCVVPEAVAMRGINVKMGDLRNTYEVLSLTKQAATCDFTATCSDGKKVRIKYDNHIIYVGLLEHKSFLTWWKQSYSPGYVIADASDEDKIYIVTEIDGEPLKIKYTNESYFFNNLERYVRNNGYANTILADFDMEINEKGVPYAPITTMENSIAMTTPVVTGVACVNLLDGEIKHYSPENAPAFVDLIYPMDVVYDRINWWGDYVYGYFHWTEKSGLTQACEGMDVVVTPQGCFYYVGIRPQTDTVGTQGYMLVDTRTGKTTYYRRSGISEAEATRVLESNTDLNVEMQQKVLELSEPIFYNIEGLPTYFSTYVSTKDNMVKYYGFCSTTDKSVWGYGKTLEDARKSYLNSYYKNESNKNVKFAEKQSLTVLEVELVEKTNINDVFYFKLKGHEDKVFVMSLSPESSDILWSVPTGHKVKVSFSPTDSKFVTLSSYEIMK